MSTSKDKDKYKINLHYGINILWKEVALLWIHLKNILSCKKNCLRLWSVGSNMISYKDIIRDNRRKGRKNIIGDFCLDFLAKLNCFSSNGSTYTESFVCSFRVEGEQLRYFLWFVPEVQPPSPLIFLSVQNMSNPCFAVTKIHPPHNKSLPLHLFLPFFLLRWWCLLIKWFWEIIKTITIIWSIIIMYLMWHKIMKTIIFWSEGTKLKFIAGFMVMLIEDVFYFSAVVGEV